MKKTVICNANIESFVRDLVHEIEYSDEYWFTILIDNFDRQEEVDVVRGLDENDDYESDPEALFKNVMDQLAYEFCAKSHKALYLAIRERFGSEFTLSFSEN